MWKDGAELLLPLRERFLMFGQSFRPRGTKYLCPLVGFHFEKRIWRDAVGGIARWAAK